jgi:hypothetical protein
VCAQLHFNIYKEIGVKLGNKGWFDHVPKLVETSHEGKVIIVWSQHLRNDITFPNNKLDIKIRDSKKETCMLIDVAISGDRSAIKKEAEKILKYKDLIIESQGMWNVKSKAISVITGATGTISKSLRQYLSNIQGKHEIKELQKKSHIGHWAHTVESVNVKVQNIFHGRNTITCNTNCKYGTAATLYTLET